MGKGTMYRAPLTGTSVPCIDLQNVLIYWQCDLTKHVVGLKR